MIALARTGSSLDDAQVQSVYHSLLHDQSLATDQPGSTWSRAALIERVFSAARTDLAHNPVYRAQRRAGLQARLEASEGQIDQLSTDRLAALARLRQGLVESEIALDVRLETIARRRGMSMREVRAEYARLRLAAPRGRQRRASREELDSLGLIPHDPATRHAIFALDRALPARTAVPLIQRWAPVLGGPVGVEVGCGDLSTIVEVRDASGRVRAFQVDSYLAERVHDHAGPIPAELVARVETCPQVEPGRLCLRCDECGQFVGDRPHHCRSGIVSIHNLIWVEIAGGRLRVAAAAMVSDVLATTGRPVMCPVQYLTGDGEVSGRVLCRAGAEAIRAPDQQTRYLVDIDDHAPHELRCATCTSSHCEHCHQAREQVRRHLAGAGTLPSATIRTQIVDAARISVTEQPSGSQISVPDPPVGRSLAEDPEYFRQLLCETDGTVPVRPAGSMRGLAAGVRFGIEIEYSGSGAVNRIHSDLVGQGIIPDRGIGGYHTGTREGWRTWSHEEDCSVAGELVTPIFTDTQQAWDQIEAVTAAVRRHGGQTDQAGSHTNISAPNFTPQMVFRLAHLVRAHEDDFYRFGRTRGSRRNLAFASALPRPVLDAASPRHGMVNFARVFRQQPRIEYRFPDASHDVGVIQAQVRLCAALTNYVRDHEVETGLHRPMHSSWNEGWAQRLRSADPDSFAQHTQPVRTLIDTLFTTDDDRTQIAALWGRGSYRRT